MSHRLFHPRLLRLALLVCCLLWQSAAAQTDAAPSRFATLDGAKVHYKSLGSGSEALVFIHGWSCNMDFWDANYPAFTDKTRVILIDLPGHGQSDKPQVTYSMDLFARAVDAVLTDAKVGRATLVGHSMGTPVIRQFYRRYPERTRALVIVDGGLRPFGSRETMGRMIEPFRGPNHRQAVEQFIGFLAQSMKDQNLLTRIRTAMTSTPQHVIVSAMEGMMDQAIWQQDKINVPTLAVMARNPAWGGDYEQFARELAPGINYQVWDGVSHFLMMDEPQKFNDMLARFLGGLDRLNKAKGRQ